MPADIPGSGAWAELHDGEKTRALDFSRAYLCARRPVIRRSTFARVWIWREEVPKKMEAGTDDGAQNLTAPLLDSLESSLSNEEEGLRKMLGFGFAATELPPRTSSIHPRKCLAPHALHTEGGVSHHMSLEVETLWSRLWPTITAPSTTSD